jgi:hypothetical protein
MTTPLHPVYLLAHKQRFSGAAPSCLADIEIAHQDMFLLEAM